MQAWIAHQRYIRRFNAIAVALLGLSLALAYAVGGPQAAGVLLVV